VICACCLAVMAGSAAAATIFPNQQRLTAMYVEDHNGTAPRTAGALGPYSSAFQKILGACRTGPDSLTMLAINLSEQASEVGGRNVTNLMMLKAIAHHITWRAPMDCSYIYSISEAHLENGDHY
jgi:hypothetical protein